MSIRILLKKDGHPDIVLKKVDDHYESLRFIDYYGEEHWDVVKMDIKDIESEIEKYKFIQ